MESISIYDLDTNVGAVSISKMIIKIHTMSLSLIMKMNLQK